MRDYGEQHPPQSFLDRNRAKIGAAMCAISAVVMLVVMAISFTTVLGRWADQRAEYHKEMKDAQNNTNRVIQ